MPVDKLFTMAYWVDGRPVGRLQRDYQEAMRRGQTERTFEEYCRAPAGSHPNAAPIAGSSGSNLEREHRDAVQSGATSLGYEAWLRQSR